MNRQLRVGSVAGCIIQKQQDQNQRMEPIMFNSSLIKHIDKLAIIAAIGISIIVPLVFGLSETL